MRLPVPLVTQHLKAILEGVLLWSADTKNQFKLKVVLPCHVLLRACSKLHARGPRQLLCVASDTT